MKIVLLTTLTSLGENKRIEEEVKALGHDFEMVDAKNFRFSVTDSKLTSAVSDIKADVVIVRGVFAAIKSIATIAQHLRAQGTKVFDNNFLEHRYSIDKVTDMIKLALAGIPVPDTRYAREFSDFPTYAAELGYPLIVKSSRMGKGASVFKIDSEDELTKFVKELEENETKAKSFIMQKFIDYAHDLRVLIIGDHVFTMERIPGNGEFRANFSLGGSVKLFDLDEAGKSLAKKALSAIDMTVGGIDILVDVDDRRFILEVNHTAGMLGMEKATGKNITRLYVEHAVANAK